MPSAPTTIFAVILESSVSSTETAFAPQLRFATSVPKVPLRTGLVDVSGKVGLRGRSTKPATISAIANYWMRHYAPPMGCRKNESDTRKVFSSLALVLCLVPACLFAQPVSTVAVGGLPGSPQVGVRQQTTEPKQRAGSS